MTVTDGRSPSDVQRRDARLAYATTAVGISAVSLIAPVLPELANRYGVSVGDVAAIQVAILVPGIASARWLLGRGADRGLHRMLGVALLGYALTGAPLYLVTHFPTVLALRIAQGVFCGGLVAGAFALLSDGGGGRERRIGLNAALVCGMMAIQPLLGSVLSLAGPTGPFLFYLTALPLGLVMLRVAGVRDPANEAGPSDGPEVLRRTSQRRALTVTVVINAMLFGWLLYLAPVLLAQQFGTGVSLRGVLLSAQAGLGVVLALVAVRALRGGGERAMILLGLIVPMVGLGIVLVSDHQAAAFLGFLLVGFTYGTANPGVVSVLTAQGRRATGAWQSSARIGQVIGPAVAGWLVSRLDPSLVLAVGIGVGLVGVVVVLAPARTSGGTLVAD